MTDASPAPMTVMVVGASRGLGLALTKAFWSRGWTVVATRRGPSPALEALAAQSGGRIDLEHLDIANASDLDRVAMRSHGRTIDVLLVNAGISIAKDDTPLTAKDEDFQAMMLTNALSPVRVAERLGPLVRKGGVIAFMSSELASLTSNPGVHDLYSASKAALNMLVRCFALRGFDRTHAIVLMAPGWTRTAIGGDQAPLTVEECVPLVATTLERSLDIPGLRFVDRHDRALPW